ncbi:MAG: hypothetical protein ACI4DO_01080 [Roseburia sp.]
MKRQMVTVLFMVMLMASVVGCGASTSDDTMAEEGQVLVEAVTEVDTEEEIMETEQKEMEEEEQEEVLFRIRIAGVPSFWGINAPNMPSSKECYEKCCN